MHWGRWGRRKNSDWKYENKKITTSFSLLVFQILQPRRRKFQKFPTNESSFKRVCRVFAAGARIEYGATKVDLHWDQNKGQSFFDIYLRSVLGIFLSSYVFVYVSAIQCVDAC